jgi:uncharacterized protein (DUF433 family)
MINTDELIGLRFGSGITNEAILQEYPRLQPEDIRVALDYAAEVLAQEDVFPLIVMPDPHISGR